jgi:serine/threonine protein kinase/Tfp pilus assembly protein PilF
MIDRISPQLESVLDRQRDAWLAGVHPTIAELVSEASLEDDADAHLDLVYNEILVREELGLEPTLHEYIQQHPHLKDELQLHFEIHNAIKQQVLLSTPIPQLSESSTDAYPYRGADQFPDDDYEMMQLLGHGGMASVYQARHRKLNRFVALKLFQQGRPLTSREVFRVRTEAEAMARISHPNIVKIFEIGECGGTPFLALELAENGTLTRKLQHFQFSPRAAAELIETLAGAIHHAHERNIIHRDLKPANVLFAGDGRPLITDFGLAKLQHDRLVTTDDVTRTGEALGTPRYMAPEQATGQTADICRATDVHGLGVLLYECLTGRAPFMATSVVQTLQQICNDDPLPPRRLQPGIPRDLETICLHCLEKRPLHRYATAKDLADDLRRFLNDEPVLARATPTLERLQKWCRRRPKQATFFIGATVFIFLSIAAVMFISMRHQAHLANERHEIAELVRDGRTALEREDIETAQVHFETAWMKVQAESELSDHETSVYGWLDHARNIGSRYEWTQRVPPPPFDERRDEALLESLLVTSGDSIKAIDVAIHTIHAALEFTVAAEPRWQPEREQLVLQAAALTERSAGPESALEMLEAAGPFTSRLYHQRRADLLERLSRKAEAAEARAAAEAMPLNRIKTVFQAAMDHFRDNDFQTATTEFDTVLSLDPAHFAARLFQAICFLKLNRPAEAHVALTACVAQRPNFQWNYYFRAQAEIARGQFEQAVDDLKHATHGRRQSNVTEPALHLLQTLRKSKNYNSSTGTE